MITKAFTPTLGVKAFVIMTNTGYGMWYDGMSR
jgi:hypothetical protein